MATTKSPSEGKAERKDTKVGRFYEIDGRQFPSVTEILRVINKPALVQWAAKEERILTIECAADLYEDAHGTPKMARPTYVATLDARIGKLRANQRLMQKAAEIGAQTHDLIQWNLRRLLGQKVGPEPRIGEKAMWSFMAWEDFAKKVALKPLLIEQAVFSLQHGYAGTMDLLALVDDVPTLVDFKTSKAIYQEAHLQVAAYQVALAEMGHGPAERGMIVRLPKNENDPAFEIAESPSVQDLFPTFKATIELWKWWFQAEIAYQERRSQKNV